MLGADLVGSGPQRVAVLNDWLCDTSSWEPARPYLDLAAFTWAFTDLRGYGRSRGQRGAFDVEEAAADVLELADHLGWRSFSVVGHSMSTLVALQLAQQQAERVERVVLVTPPPPAGLGYAEQTLAAVRSIALADDARRIKMIGAMLGDRLGAGWVRFKADRWRATADPEAAAAYVSMFGARGLPDAKAPVRCPGGSWPAESGCPTPEPLPPRIWR